jgi:hypothetical protein
MLVFYACAPFLDCPAQDQHRVDKMMRMGRLRQPLCGGSTSTQVVFEPERD